MAEHRHSVHPSQLGGPWPADVGILDMELYFPYRYVDQSALETYDGVPAGKYTIGLGQKEMGFCTDREDICSISLTVVRRLLDRQAADLCRAIGRLEVGTETLIDKSKSVKSVLMQLFEPYDQMDVEGVDTINACFGGTQALFNALNWIESSSWDGRLAVVVMADIAIYGEGSARSTGGAGALAMLIGPNASIVFDRAVRSIHVRHAYDFYKPNMASEYPVVDGPLSIECYMNSLDRCYTLFCEKFAKAKDESDISLEQFDACLFHSPFAKLVQKSFSRLRYLDLVRNPDRFSGDATNDAVLKYKNTIPESAYNDKEMEKTFMEFSRELFTKKTEPSLWLATHLGNMYTPSLYSCLISYLLRTPPEDLKDGARIMLFSYGSGSAAAMFSARIRRGTPKESASDTASTGYSFEKILKNLQDISARMAQRQPATPDEFIAALKWREESHGKASYTPQGKVEDLFPGTYYLKEVDEKYRRTYEVTKYAWVERNGPVKE